MIRLFRRFDLGYFGFASLFVFGIVLILFLSKVTKRSIVQTFFKEIFFMIKRLMWSTKPGQHPKGFHILGFSVFLIVLAYNICAIFPFLFPITTQISSVLFIALYAWGSFVFFSIAKSIKKFISHKIPEGSPLGLSFLLFAIELVREIIRPLTLTLRLVGNIVVGHVLLSLLFMLVQNFNWCFPLYLLLNAVEIIVAFIQAYIFFTLVRMYFSEV